MRDSRRVCSFYRAVYVGRNHSTRALNSNIFLSKVSGRPLLLSGLPPICSLNQYNLTIRSFRRPLAVDLHLGREVAALGDLVFITIQSL